MAYPKAQDYADFQRGLQQRFATGEMGFEVSLHGSNSEPLMSALGHSRPGPAGRRSSHVRYAPKATVGH
jgi:hypothetical protein